MRAARIQRRRATGWRMPRAAVYVGRGSKWGNPFVVGKHGNRERCLQLFVALCAGYLMISTEAEHVEAQRRLLRALKGVKALKGKVLACWCREGDACHGDVLCALANGQPIPKAWTPQLTRLG